MIKTLPCFLLVVLLTAASGSAQLLGARGPSLAYDASLETDAVYPGGVTRLALEFTLSEGWHVNAHKPLEEFLIGTELRFETHPEWSVEGVLYPEAEIIELGFSPDQPVAVYEEHFSIGALLRAADNAAPGEYVLKGSLRWQACNDTQCAMPQTLDIEVPVRVVPQDQALTPQHAQAIASVDWDQEAVVPELVLASATDTAAKTPAEDGVLQIAENWRTLADEFEVVGSTGYVSANRFIEFVQAGKRGESVDRNPLAGKSVWLVMWVVLFGGLLLNLTPCVLPLIPINIAIIGAGARAGSRGRGFAMGSAYGIAIALVYGALGLLVVLGLSTAFGAINATVWFNAAIAVLFYVLALAMFDVIPIDFSRFQAKLGIRGNERGSFAVAFGMGAVSALLAGACVAPVVIFTLLFALDLYAQGNQVAVLLPFLLGLGMGLPWPFAGALMSFLPKPGAWMTKVKYGFGVFILLFACYYGYQAYTLAANKYFVDRDAVAASVEAADEDGWISSLEQGLAQAKAENKPVLIDFWATWCKNCLIMNETVLKETAVLAELEDVVKIKYQAEDPSAGQVREVWEYYKLIGLPTYLMLQPKG